MTSDQLKFTRKPRPYWYVDAKWIVSFIALAIVSAAALTSVLARITQKESAVDLSTVVVASLLSPEGLDNQSSIDSVRQTIQKSATKSIKPFPGLNLVIHESDLNGKTPREIRLAFFRTLTEPLYEKGADGLTELAETPEMTKQLDSGVSLLQVVSRDTHDRLVSIAQVLIFISIGLTAFVVFFSYGFGRLASPGWILVTVSALPMFILTVLRTMPTPPTPAAGAEVSFTQQLSTVMANVFPIVRPLALSVYQPLFIVGVVLVASAMLGGVIRNLILAKKRAAD